MSSNTKRGPNDPDRADRITAAALEIIAAEGIHRASHRTIAARAGVPLGSLTYYFADLRELHEAAFRLLAERLSARYRTALETAPTRDAAANVVVGLIVGDEYVDATEMHALFQMYASGNHDEGVRRLCRQWLEESRASLGLHFSPSTCRALDALVEGWPIHRVFEGGHLDRTVVDQAVRAIIAGLEDKEEQR